MTDRVPNPTDPVKAIITVEEGDTISELCEKLYGSSSKFLVQRVVVQNADILVKERNKRGVARTIGKTPFDDLADFIYPGQNLWFEQIPYARLEEFWAKRKSPRQTAPMKTFHVTPTIEQSLLAPLYIGFIEETHLTVERIMGLGWHIKDMAGTSQYFRSWEDAVREAIRVINPALYLQVAFMIGAVEHTTGVNVEMTCSACDGEGEDMFGNECLTCTGIGQITMQLSGVLELSKQG